MKWYKATEVHPNGYSVIWEIAQAESFGHFLVTNDYVRENIGNFVVEESSLDEYLQWMSEE